jgi:uncharacterized membrane protein
MSDETPKPADADSNQPPTPPAGGAPPPPPPPNAGAPQPPAGPPAPPPPPGAGGQVPGYPPAGGYPQGAAPQGNFSVGSAFNFGWTKFQQNLGPWIIASLIAIVIFALLGLFYGILAGLGTTGATLTVDPVTGQLESFDGGVATWFIIVGPLWSALMALVAWVIGAQFIRAALEIARVGKIELEVFTRTDKLGTVIIAALILAATYFVLGIIGIIPILGWIVLFVGSILLGFFTQFFVYFILDQGKSSVEGLKGSVNFVNKNIATVIVLALASWLAIFIGAILCLIGLFVALPVVVMAHAYTYRSLTGQGVSA